jgi:hypothetical protein
MMNEANPFLAAIQFDADDLIFHAVLIAAKKAREEDSPYSVMLPVFTKNSQSVGIECGDEVEGFWCTVYADHSVLLASQRTITHFLDMLR